MTLPFAILVDIFIASWIYLDELWDDFNQYHDRNERIKK